MMEGFGVHTFRLVNAQGKVDFCEVSLEAVVGHHITGMGRGRKIWPGKTLISIVAICGKRLTRAIRRVGAWRAVVDEADEFKYDFDILGCEQVVAGRPYPGSRIGKMTLNRNPDSYFAETEQVAFHTAHVVPGIDFTNDPLLQGRNFSYLDTQLTRLGGPNFAELPINRPIQTASNNQRDGHMRYTVNKGTVSYEPNSLNSEKPGAVPVAQGGYASYPAKVEGSKVRERSKSFNDHYGQAQLFWNSMSQPEKNHIISALQFELSKVETTAIRQRMLAHLAHINDTLAGTGSNSTRRKSTQQRQSQRVVYRVTAYGIGRTDRWSDSTTTSTPTASGGFQRTSGLSMEEIAKDSIKTRKVAIMVADGVAGAQVVAIKAALKAEGALPLIVAPHIGTVNTSDGAGNSGGQNLRQYRLGGLRCVFRAWRQECSRFTQQDEILSFVHEGFKHGKAIGAVAEGVDLLVMAKIGSVSKAKSAPGVTAKQGVVTASGGTHVQEVAAQFITAMKQGRNWTRALKEEVPA